eukprot:gnl/Ergobibamus_cyprinoides/609.p1 GENE.gnl/Ergobibamus_cyprinoides/609~~gnl/Ergobibamus_cyprinoides/609.p1  ORF type:complete len:256 (+),score=75.76 gnl/Ergobibamus_cyprinoides/609:622-1389(+)
MHRFRSGKLPKAFNTIPSCHNWEELLWLTEPFEWSAQATYAATRQLASKLTDKVVVRYYRSVLLPICVDDIKENKSLNYHLFRALKKAAYKPSAFYKGLVLPLAADPKCTLRTATIFASAMQQVSTPPIYAATALANLAGMPYRGTTSLFIRALIDKRYALPVPVVDALCAHFVRLAAEAAAENIPTLPVLWQQALLAFVQRYKHELTAQQHKEVLQAASRNQHPAITQEIRRELAHARTRGMKAVASVTDELMI